MPTGISTIDRSIQKTKEWIKSIQKNAHLATEEQAYSAFQSVIHVLRDMLIPNEAVKFAAQLPLILRGVYYSGWKLANKPERIKTKQEFINMVSITLPNSIDPLQAISGVLISINKHLSQGEIKDIKAELSENLRSLWPE
jgi:uncharacterized protein (DUF2267 family)